MLTYTEDHPVKDRASEEKPPQIPKHEAVTSGLQNLLFINDLELNGQISSGEGVSLELSPALSDTTEESPETGLSQLKDEYHGHRYSVVVLPKQHADGTQRLVVDQNHYRTVM